MPRRKPNPEKIKEQQKKESLDSIIIEEESIDSFKADLDQLPEMKPVVLKDFNMEMAMTESEALEFLQKLSDFYTEGEDVKSGFVGLRQKMDSSYMSSMAFQLKTTQHAVIKILEEIEMGTMNPKLFEVLGQLQSKLSQMAINYQLYMDKIESQYKRIKDDIEHKKQINGVIMNDQGGEYKPIENAGGFKSRGTLSIMEGLREIIKDGNIIDVNPIEVTAENVVNARDKLIIDKDNPNLNNKKNNDNEININDMLIEDDIIE